MAITFVGGVQGGRAGSTATTTQSISTTLTGGSNTSPSAGDLVVVWCASASDSTGSPTDQAISGNNSGAYSTLTFQSTSATTYDTFSQMSYKIQGGTVDTTLTIPSSGNARNAQRWVVQVFRGVDATTPIDVTSIYASGTGTGRPNPDAITPSTAGAWIVTGYASAAATGTVYTTPTGVTNPFWPNTSLDTADCMIGATFYNSWTSGSYDPPAVTAGGTTNAADSWTATTLAIRPALPAFTQASYRYYEDGTETGSTAIDAQDTNITRDVNSDSNLQLRVRLQETNGTAGDSTDDYQLQYELNDSGVHYNIDSDIVAEQSTSSSSSGKAIQGSGGTNEAQGLELVSASANSVESVSVILGKTGTPSDNLQINIRTGSMTGSIIGTSDAVAASSVPVVASRAFVNFPFSTPVARSSGVTYYYEIVRSGSRDTSNYVAVYGNALTSRGYTSSSGSWSVTFSEPALAVYTSSPVLSFASASLTDGNATTNRLGAGSGSFVAGEISEDGLVDNFTHTASNYTEHLYSLTLVSSALANNDTLDFRVLRNGATTGMTYTVTPRITASKSAGGYTGTPSVASLTLTGFAPTVAVSDNKTATPSVASLTLTAFAASVIIGTTLTPSVASLSLTTFAPTATVSNNISVTPSATSLSLTGQAPTVTATDNKSATPSLATLSLSTFSPTIAVSDNKSAVPSTASLTLTGLAPTTLLNTNLIPSVASLTLSGQAPTATVSDNKTATPSLATLSLSTFAPTVTATNNQFATPSTSSLTLTGQAPSTIIGTRLTPSVASLSLTGIAPTAVASDNKAVTPSIGTLSLTTYAPTVVASDHKTATPTVASLTLTPFAPTVSNTAGVLVTPDLATLTLTTFAGTVAVSDNKSATPDIATLTLTTFDPTVTVTNGFTVTPTVASLSLSTFAPSVVATDNKTATPSATSLTLTTHAPTVVASDNKSAVPTPASLTLSPLSPTVTATNNQFATPSTASLSLTTFAPTVTATANVFATPDTASLTLTTFDLDATVGTASYVLTPDATTLTLTPSAPTILVNNIVTPDTASITLNSFAPTVLVNTLATPSPASLTLTGYAPSYVLSDNYTGTPTTTTLTLTGYAPTVLRYRPWGIGEGETSTTYTPVTETTVTWTATDNTSSQVWVVDAQDHSATIVPSDHTTNGTWVANQ